MDIPYHLPAILEDANGNPRAAGFEFEFGNLPVVETAKALQNALGGDLEVISPFEAILTDTQVGKLKVERDADLLKSVRYRKWLQKMGVEFEPGTLAHDIETNIDSASSGLVPCEVVTAPIPFTELHKLDILGRTLSGLGAQGTGDSIRYAFGLHINPSLPDSSSTTLVRYIQAFLLLHAWIIEASSIDITRRFLTKYIDPFPQEYALLVLDPDYKPGQASLISDYMAHNPTRNRALDLLPILCDFNRNAVISALSEEERNLVKGRPAFHYRLPDCRVNEPGWSVALPWNQWVCIESLAADEALLGQLMQAWKESSSSVPLIGNLNWVLRLTSILSQKYLIG